MKRKLSLLMAFMTAATLIPTASFAVTTNNVNRVISTTYNDGTGYYEGTVLSNENYNMPTIKSSDEVVNYTSAPFLAMGVGSYRGIVPDVNLRLSAEDKTKESLENRETFELHLEGGGEWAYSSDWTAFDPMGYQVGHYYSLGYDLEKDPNNAYQDYYVEKETTMVPRQYFAGGNRPAVPAAPANETAVQKRARIQGYLNSLAVAPQKTTEPDSPVPNNAYAIYVGYTQAFTTNAEGNQVHKVRYYNYSNDRVYLTAEAAMEKSDANIDSSMTKSDLNFYGWIPTREAFKARRQTAEILEVQMLKALDKETNTEYEKAGINVPIFADLSGSDNGPQKVVVVDKGSRATAGTYTFANIADDQIKMRVSRKEKISRSGENRVDLIFEEMTKGAFNNRNTIELRLPSGFTWANQSNTSIRKTGNRVIDATEVTNGEIVGYSDDERTIVIRPNPKGKTGNDPEKLDTIYLKAKLIVDRTAPLGDVDVVVVKGDVTPTSLVIAENVMDLVSLTPKKVLDVISGKDEYGKYKSTVVIEENVANALLDGKYMELSLGTMKDGKFVQGNVSLQDGEQMKLKRMGGAATLEIDRDSCDALAGQSRFLRAADVVTSRAGDNVAGDNWDLRVQNSSKDAGKSKYELEIPFVVGANLTGDIVLNAKGAGVGDGKQSEVNVVIAKAKAPVTIETANPLPQVKIGLQDQKGSDITVKETEAAALQDYVPIDAYLAGGWTSVINSPIQEPNSSSSKDDKGLNRNPAGDKYYVQVDNGTGDYVRVSPNHYERVVDLNVLETDPVTGKVVKGTWNGVTYTKADFKFVLRDGWYRTYKPKNKNQSYASYFIEMDQKFSMKFTKLDSVKVTEGDLKLNDDKTDITSGDKAIEIAVDRRSTKPSTMKLSGIQVTLDRTVPYGKVDLKGKFGITAARHDLSNVVKTFNYFNTVTPVDETKRITTVFTIGEKGYVEVNGVVRTEKTAEVAPFIQNDRTMLPLRYVAEALNAAVSYDSSTRVATFSKNQIVASINIDEDKMYVNGSPVPLDSKPANVEGRIFLPVANIAQVFGLEHGKTIIWNQEAKTVTILPLNATQEEIDKANAGKTLEGTMTLDEANKKEEVKKEEEKKPEEKKADEKKADEKTDKEAK